jgi:serine/threonine-protein kinase 24/25/MST4
MCRYHGAFLKQSHLWIIMEYCSGGSCADLVSCPQNACSPRDFKLKRSRCCQLKAVGVFREEYISILARELLKGLEYLHGENKLHRDIKGTFECRCPESHSTEDASYLSCKHSSYIERWR